MDSRRCKAEVAARLAGPQKSIHAPDQNGHATRHSVRAQSFKILRSLMSTTPGRSMPPSTHSRWWLLLLLIPFVALLWVPFYNRIDPVLFSIPFFYWYQFLWVFLTSLIIIIVDALTREADRQE